MLTSRLMHRASAWSRRGLASRRHVGVPQWTARRFNSSNPSSTGQYTPDPTDQNGSEEDGKGGTRNEDPNLKSTILKMFETAATTAASIAILGLDHLTPLMLCAR